MRHTIEQPKISDTLELAKLHNQSWIETYPNDEFGISKEFIENRISNRLSKEGLERREEAIKSSLNAGTYFLRIARDESGNIVGFIDGNLKENEYWLDGLYTLKSTYGTGLGKQLWEAFLPWTKNKDILLTVASYNHRAIAFYTKLGFTKVDGSEGMFADTPMPIINMIRKAE
ncbi:MAG: GNAT family N-acetyltransferase [Patescibacteria group bacterium]